MNGIGTTTRFVAVLVGTVLFACVAALGFWAHDHAQRRAAILAAHAGLVLRDLGDAVEARLALGLPLAQLPEMDRLLDSARLQLPAAQAVTVVDERGRVVFSTDPAEVGETLKMFAMQGSGAVPEESDGHQIAAAKETFWHALTTEYGAVTGAVAVRLPAGSVKGETLSFALAMAVGLAPYLGAVLAMAAAVGAALARIAGRPVALAAAQLEALSRGEAVSAGDAAAFQPLTATVQRLNQVLESGERELIRLDELA